MPGKRSVKKMGLEGLRTMSAIAAIALVAYVVVCAAPVSYTHLTLPTIYSV